MSYHSWRMLWTYLFLRSDELSSLDTILFSGLKDPTLSGDYCMTDDERVLFPSEEWLAKYKEILNASKTYEDAAHDWEGDFVFEIEADETLGETVRFYMDLWHGKCRDARMAGQDETAEFTYSGPAKNWRLLFAKKIDPIKGLMQRKFRLGKGNDMGKIMRYTKAAAELVEATTKVPTRFPDE